MRFRHMVDPEFSISDPVSDDAETFRAEMQVVFTGPKTVFLLHRKIEQILANVGIVIAVFIPQTGQFIESVGGTDEGCKPVVCKPIPQFRKC